MHRALGLLILAAEGALAQSREPSHWDANVAAAFNVNGCPCNSTAHDCRPDNGATMKQSEMNELKVTYMTEVPLKFAYLTDQDGTILDYHTKGWETGSEEGNLVKFTWDASMQPTRLVPHIVYENSCADVFPSVAVQTWRTALALLSEEYDVGNSPEESPSRPPSPPAPPPSPPAPPPSPQLPVNAPPVTPPPAPVSTPLPLGTPTIDVNSDIVLDDDWFNGGEAKASFPDARDSIPAGRNAMWLQNQDGTIIYYELSESADAAGLDFQQRPFPRGTLDLHACRLFPTTKLCATENIRDKYITKVEEISSPASVGAYTSSNKPFTDVFTGHFDPGPKADQDKGKPGRTSIGPKSGSDCTKKNATGHPLTDADGKKLAMEYVIYAKELNADGVEESNAAVLGFAFDKALHFDGTTATKFKVYLTCCTKRKCSGSGTGSGLTLTTGTMDLNVFLGPTTYSVLGPDDYEKQADAPRCHDHDGHDHAEGAEEEEEEGHPSDNTTWFKHEGRDCMCDMGTLKCKRAGAGSPFSMNEGETVGLVIAVSAIVFICIGAIFFFGYSAMLKRKARDTGVVLQSDGDRL